MKHFPINILISKTLAQRLHGLGIVTLLDFKKAKRSKLSESLVGLKLHENEVEQLFSEIDSQIAKLEEAEQRLLVQQKFEYNYLRMSNLQNIFRIGGINILIGETCSGKSTLLWRLVMENVGTVQWLDCAYNLNMRRVRQVCSAERLKTVTTKSVSTITELNQIEFAADIVILDGLLSVYQEFNDLIYKLQHVLHAFMKKVRMYLYQVVRLQENIDHSQQVCPREFDSDIIDKI